MIKILLAALVAVLLSGCATLTDENSTARLTTYYGSLKYIDGDPERAARLAEIATNIAQYAANTNNLTVDLLIQAVRAQVRWERLDAADEMLAQALIDELRAGLVRRFGENVLPADLTIAVDTLAGWVITASRM